MNKLVKQEGKELMKACPDLVRRTKTKRSYFLIDVPDATKHLDDLHKKYKVVETYPEK